jgi:hypothetical protein
MDFSPAPRAAEFTRAVRSYAERFGTRGGPDEVHNSVVARLDDTHWRRLPSTTRGT